MATGGHQVPIHIMVPAASSTVRIKNTFLKSRFHSLAARRDKKRATVAATHSMLVSAWHRPTYQQPCQELRGGYFDQRKRESKVSYLVRQLEKLTGGSVSFELRSVGA